MRRNLTWTFIVVLAGFAVWWSSQDAGERAPAAEAGVREGAGAASADGAAAPPWRDEVPVARSTASAAGDPADEPAAAPRAVVGRVVDAAAQPVAGADVILLAAGAQDHRGGAESAADGCRQLRTAAAVTAGAITPVEVWLQR